MVGASIFRMVKKIASATFPGTQSRSERGELAKIAVFSRRVLVVDPSADFAIWASGMTTDAHGADTKKAAGTPPRRRARARGSLCSTVMHTLIRRGRAHARSCCLNESREGVCHVR
jgi:hypothetical protein